ncbi:MAG: hypothetical protein QXQ68_08975 [Candidatus Nitrosocaldaceae archaeon]
MEGGRGRRKGVREDKEGREKINMVAKGEEIRNNTMLLTLFS